MSLEERIEQQLRKLREQREQVVVQANRQLAAIDGAVAVLEELLKEEPEQTSPDDAKVGNTAANNDGSIAEG